MPGTLRTTESITVVRGEAEVMRRAGHLLETAQDLTCAASRLSTWSVQAGLGDRIAGPDNPRRRVRKLYRTGMLLDAGWTQRIRAIRAIRGAQVRVTTQDLNETIVIDGRLVILAGGDLEGERTYSLITQPETVAGVSSLFEAAWASGTDLDVYDAQVAEIREIAPQVLDLLTQGVKDELAARTLGLGLRTYRRRVAELMAALGSESRFQAGVRARELGLV